MTLSNKTVLRLVKPRTHRSISADAVAAIKLHLEAEALLIIGDAEAELDDENAMLVRCGKAERRRIGFRQVERALRARREKNAPGREQNGEH